MSEQQQPFGNFRLPDTSSFSPRPIVAPISDYTGGRIATALELIAGAIGQVTAAKLLEPKPPATEAAEIVIPKRILDRAATMLSAWRSDLSRTESAREAAWAAFLAIETSLAADNPTMPRFRLAEDIRR